eukprot:1355419-Rhodomonas_salina.3
MEETTREHDVETRVLESRLAFKEWQLKRASVLANAGVFSSGLDADRHDRDDDDAGGRQAAALRDSKAFGVGVGVGVGVGGGGGGGGEEARDRYDAGGEEKTMTQKVEGSRRKHPTPSGDVEGSRRAREGRGESAQNDHQRHGGRRMMDERVETTVREMPWETPGVQRDVRHSEQGYGHMSSEEGQNGSMHSEPGRTK